MKEKEAAASRILWFLNMKTGYNFKSVKGNIDLIMARLEEHTEHELTRMVAFMVSKWGKDDQMRQYLRPVTLFGKTKCEQYVGMTPPERTVNVEEKKEEEPPFYDREAMEQLKSIARNFKGMK